MSDYGTPPPPPPAPGYNQPSAGVTPPPNYLVWAILSTIFCCLPFGIASIVFAAQVNGKYALGDVAGAQDSSAKARRFASSPRSSASSSTASTSRSSSRT